MDIRNNETGTTFLTTLLTFAVIVITLPLIVHLLTFIQPIKQDNDLSVQQFFIYLRDDALKAEHVYSEGNKMYFFLSPEETACIEQYQDVIRRQVNGRGHEIYLRNIDSFTAQPIIYGTKVSITTTEGEIYEKTIAHYE